MWVIPDTRSPCSQIPLSVSTMPGMDSPIARGRLSRRTGELMALLSSTEIWRVMSLRWSAGVEERVRGNSPSQSTVRMGSTAVILKLEVSTETPRE